MYLHTPAPALSGLNNKYEPPFYKMCSQACYPPLAKPSTSPVPLPYRLQVPVTDNYTLNYTLMKHTDE